jgi:polysaccharide export outer membrane protein
MAPSDAPPRDTGEYRLRVGDSIRVQFTDEEQLSYQTQLTPTGTITVPFGGEILATGLTTAELAEAISGSVSGYLRHPAVSVLVSTLAPQPVFVIGEVKTPGSFESVSGLTVTSALASAGGILETGKTSSVMVVRTDGVDEPVAYRVDVRDVLSGRDLSSDMALRPNDVVYVPKSFIGDVGTFVRLFFANIAPAQLFYLRGYEMLHVDDDNQIYYGQ